MSEGTGMDIGAAKSYAKLFILSICDFCEKVEIAGSVRRGKQKVHDIEILATPVFSTIEQVLIDGVKRGTVNSLHMRMVRLQQDGIVTADRMRKDKHKDPFGERYYRVNYNFTDLKIPVDLFVVIPPAQWGTQLLIRTGCAEFSHWVVSRRIDQGLRFKDGHLEHDTTGVIDTPTEESVFKALRMPYVPPEQREMDEQGKPKWERLGNDWRG